MSRAQGEYRGPARDAEEQYAGGDAAVAAGTTEQAQRTIAAREYRAVLADGYLHEVWDKVCHPGCRAGRDCWDAWWQLVGYRSTRTGELAERPGLARQRRAALGY